MSDHNSLPYTFLRINLAVNQALHLCVSLTGDAAGSVTDTSSGPLVQITISTHLPLLVPTHKLTPPNFLRIFTSTMLTKFSLLL